MNSANAICIGIISFHCNFEFGPFDAIQMFSLDHLRGLINIWNDSFTHTNQC